MKVSSILASLLVAVGINVVGAAWLNPVQARTLEEIKADGKIIIASEGAYAPFNYFQGSKLTGFEIELGDAVAAKMGLKVEWKALSFDALLTGLRQDRWDMVIASFGITEERAKAVTFANPHYCSGGMIVSKDPAIRTAENLAGKTVAVQTGTTYFENIKKVPGIKEVRNLPLDTDARAALQNGRVDVWVSDKFVVKAALDANPGGALKMGELVFVEKIATAFKKGNSSLAAAYNKALADMMADGSYKTISEKYFKEDIRCK
jgi:polar amino acid transport system substrate-binding protein